MVCALRVSSTITLQVFILPAILQRHALYFKAQQNFDKVGGAWNVGQGAPCQCVLSVSRTITMQGFILPAITVVEKCTLFLDDVKFWQSRWSMKCRSRAPGHGAWLLSVSRTITMHLTAVTGVGSSPTRITSETSQVLLAGCVRWFFPGYSRFRPTFWLARLNMSEINLERDVKLNKKKKKNNYARYHTPRYHCCREMHFIF